MTKPMTDERRETLNRLAGSTEYYTPIELGQCIWECLDEIVRFRKENAEMLNQINIQTDEFDKEMKRLREELTGLLSEKSALTGAVIDLREKNEQLVTDFQNSQKEFSIMRKSILDVSLENWRLKNAKEAMEEGINEALRRKHNEARDLLKEVWPLCWKTAVAGKIRDFLDGEEK